MTIDQNVVNALVVGGLLSTAGVLWRAVIKLAELGVHVDGHGDRLARLERLEDER